jgi:hypothetical protein
MRTALCAGLLFVLIQSTGCGPNHPKTAPVSGKISMAGKAVPTGTITFIPNTPGTSATGEIGPDGSYTLTTFSKGDGAVIGSHKVIIVAMADMKDRLPEDRSPTPPPLVPNKYTSLATTDLTAEVKDEKNVIDFDLKEDGVKRK